MQVLMLQILNKTKQIPRVKTDSTLGIRLNADLIKDLKQTCKDEDVFPSHLIETFIVEFLKCHVEQFNSSTRDPWAGPTRALGREPIREQRKKWP